MTMKPVAIIPQIDPPYRDSNVVDSIVGKKRKAIDKGPIDFSKCQLAKAYPTFDDFLEEIHQQREAQKAGGPLMHQAARPPARNATVDRVLKRETPPWENGPSAADVHKAYGTKS